MWNKTQNQLKTLSDNLLAKPTQEKKTIERFQKWNQPCKTCEDTETGIPTGLVITNDVGASGLEKFSLHDCPTCKGQKFVYK
jgi:DnaJ-class molecular chaperone